MVKFKKETEFKNTEIGEVPREWEVKKLGEVIDIKHGFAFPSRCFKENGKVPVIKIQNIQENNTVDLNNIQFVNPDELKKI